MIQALRKLVTFDEFITWYPENPQQRYELHDGVIVEMAPPTGDHEEVVGFLALEISAEIKRLKLPYFIPKTAFIKPLENESAYSPDVLILNRTNLVNEPLWKKESTVSQAASIPLVIEVVSTNWRDDYLQDLRTGNGKSNRRGRRGHGEIRVSESSCVSPNLKKVADYEAVSIPEYWIVDYAALGGKRFIGNPKQPTLWVYSLVEGEYQVRQFRNSERIVSFSFPELNLTAEQIFQAGGLPT